MSQKDEKPDMVWREFDELLPHPMNSNTHPKEQIDSMASMLDVLGDGKIQISVQKSSGRVMTGHGLIESMKQEGHVGAWVIEKDYDDATALAWMEADNQYQSLSVINKPMQLANLVELKRMDVKIEPIGFELKAIETLRREIDNRVVVEDDPPEVSEEVVSKTGDLWELGNHALFCGDSSDPANLQRLLHGHQVDLGITSPPYAVGKEYEVGVSFDQHLTLLRSIADRSLEAIKPGGFFVINFGEIAPQSHASPMTGSDRQCLYPISKDYWQIFHEERRMDLYAQRVWYKPFNRLQQPFWTYKTSIPHHQEWEHIWTWRLPGGEGDRVYNWDISSRAVWDTRKEATDDRPLTRHVAAFPVCLPERAILAHCDEGSMVWDPFCGSGTTLVVANYQGRICMAAEINPAYCDVIVKRYINHVGSDEHVSVERNGKTLTWEQAQKKLPKVV